jgi:hypothetical protein
MEGNAAASFRSHHRGELNVRIKSPEDFWSGLMFIGFGLLAVVVARDYPMGSAMRMGPGYFPTYIGAVLIVLGSVVTALSFRWQGEGIGHFTWRGMILLSLGFLFFGWAIDRVGFVIALAGLIVLAALAGREFKLKEVVVLTVALIVGSWALFIWGLELPFPLFWR